MDVKAYRIGSLNLQKILQCSSLTIINSNLFVYKNKSLRFLRIPLFTNQANQMQINCPLPLLSIYNNNPQSHHATDLFPLMSCRVNCISRISGKQFDSCRIICKSVWEPLPLWKITRSLKFIFLVQSTSLAHFPSLWCRVMANTHF